MPLPSPRNQYIAAGLAAAFLFGAGTQASKYLLGSVPPATMAGLLYLGSGAGLLFVRAALAALGRRRSQREATLSRGDLPWLLLTMLLGSFLGPVVLMFSLPHTPGATAALLLNFEGIATMLIAALVIGEPVGRRVGLSIVVIATSCALLTYTPEAAYGVSPGALGILAACTIWGIDNNVIQRISDKDPLSIIMVKGLGASVLSLALGRCLGEALPPLSSGLAAMAVGVVSLGGLMSVCLVLAIRGLGSARGAAIFSLSPFFGVGFAFLVFADLPGPVFYAALALMIVGSILLVTEHHTHAHTHPGEVHEHRHRHDDMHHAHAHRGDDPPLDSRGYHSHLHRHEEMEHTHTHSPDIHHRHRH
ncbi:MAG: DMT family transporter [Methanospirillum sp.]|mgnify:CR=1 FL=1|nr:DMT family transporter [Methanospirillum sp.]